MAHPIPSPARYDVAVAFVIVAAPILTLGTFEPLQRLCQLFGHGHRLIFLIFA
jgi:hypothetical protein